MCWRRMREAMKTALLTALLLTAGRRLLLFFGLCEGVIALSDITVRPRGKTSKAEYLRWIWFHAKSLK